MTEHNPATLTETLEGAAEPETLNTPAMSEDPPHVEGLDSVPTAVEDSEEVAVESSVGDGEVAITSADETPVADTDPPTLVEQRTGENPRATLTQQAKGPLKPNHAPLTGDRDSIAVVPVNSKELDELADNYPPFDAARLQNSDAWLGSIREGVQYLHRGMALINSLDREDGHWAQSVTAGGEQLRAGLPRFGDSTPGTQLTGEQAMMKLQSALGLGATVRVPLWHTGLWVTMKAPTEAALLELDRRIANEKVILGRQSNGLLFSNSSIYASDYLVNFALAHVYDATYKYNSTDDLRDVIRIPDIPSLLWGLACTIFPNGFPLRQPCVDDPTKCSHVTEELLNISKLSWTDDRALTDWQRRLMVRRNSKFTPEELKRYDEEHRYYAHTTVELHPNLVMELKVPTLNEQSQAGFSWVDSIVSNVDKAYGGTLKGEQRNEYILEQGRITAMQQYAHWIKRLVLRPSGELVEDRETIEDNIATMTSDTTLFTTFFNGIGKFIDETTISLIAIPKYNCPTCKAPMTEGEQRHPHLIALDVANIFFTLLGHRIYRVLQSSHL